jgi:hypothetical protein
MKVPIKVRVRRGEDKLVIEDAILWIDEVPPEYRRGPNRKMKTRRHKRERMERRQEDNDVPRR